MNICGDPRAPMPHNFGRALAELRKIRQICLALWQGLPVSIRVVANGRWKALLIATQMPCRHYAGSNLLYVRKRNGRDQPICKIAGGHKDIFRADKFSYFTNQRPFTTNRNDFRPSWYKARAACFQPALLSSSFGKINPVRRRPSQTFRRSYPKCHLP